MLVTANAQKRLDFVLPKMKQHQDQLVWIVMNAMGLEQRAKMTHSIVGPKWTLAGKRSTLEEVLAAVRDRLEVASVVDRYIPWLATRLNKTKLAANSFYDLVDLLVQSFRSICIWASETKTDLNKLTLEEAIAQSDEYVPNAARKGTEESEANPVVYRFADGHKVVELRTKEALKREGEIMRHCVGDSDYCEAVEDGTVVIFSLRNHGGAPLVTMQYQPASGEFNQIFGPSNTEVPSEVKPLVLEFLKNNYPYEAEFIIQMGGSFEDIDFSNMKSMSLRSRHYLADSFSTPSSVLGLLAKDENWYIRFLVARNRSTPISVLEALSTDKRSEIHHAASANFASRKLSASNRLAIATALRAAARALEA